MKRVFLLFFCLSIMALRGYAVPAYPGLVEVKQPDGTSITVRIYGDENFSYVTTSDGYLLKENAVGVYEYADIKNGLCVATGVKASATGARKSVEDVMLSTLPHGDALHAKMQKMMRSAEAVKMMKAKASDDVAVKRFPLQGQPKSLVILVNFNNLKFTVDNPQEAYTRLLNESGYSDNYATGSARDYFIASSDSLFAPVFDVVGPVDLPRNYEEFGQQLSEDQHDKNPDLMVTDACQAAQRGGLVNLQDYDTDGDGVLDNVFIYYAGHNQAEGGGANTIWPHRGRVDDNVSIGGVFVRDYACTSEYSGSAGERMCGIGTFCHEFGHVLGLPDLYITDYEAHHATPGEWDIMDQGSYNNSGRTPPVYSSYERFFLGWHTPEQLTADSSGVYTLDPLATGGGSYLVAASQHNLNGSNPNPTEFFMIENRQRVGADEFALPGTGMLVWHIRYNPSTWGSNTPNNDGDNMGVDIVRADGVGSNYAGDTYPGARDVTYCGLKTSKGEILPDLTNITEVNEEVSFTFGGGEDQPNITVTTEPETFVSIEANPSPIQTVEVVGRHLPSAITVKADYYDPVLFRKAGTDDAFLRELKLYPSTEDSALLEEIEIRCEPEYLTYNRVVETSITITCDSLERVSYVLPIRWQSMRDVYVVPPVANEAENVTPYSFVASWDSVFDATLYYLTLYKMSEEEGTLVESFETFDEATPLEWHSTFNLTNSLQSASGKSAYFTMSSDTLTTETYFMPAKGISFWMSSITCVGTFTVEAYDGEAWTNVATIDVVRTTSASTRSYDFDEALGYVKFRFCFAPASGSGGVLIDDFTFKSSKKLEYVFRQTDVMELGATKRTDTVLTIGNLDPESIYYYKVKASDKDIEYGRYENITDYSNTIEVVTLETGIPEDLKPKHKERWIAVSIRPDNSGYVAYVPEVLENHYLYIYTINGSLVASIPVTSNEIVIPQLTNGQIYIIKYSAENDIKRKDKYAKFFYNIN